MADLIHAAASSAASATSSTLCRSRLHTNLLFFRLGKVGIIVGEQGTMIVPSGRSRGEAWLLLIHMPMSSEAAALCWGCGALMLSG